MFNVSLFFATAPDVQIRNTNFYRNLIFKGADQPLVNAYGQSNGRIEVDPRQANLFVSAAFKNSPNLLIN